MERTGASAAGWFTWALAYALVTASVAVVAGAIGIAYWSGGYGIIAGLLLLASAGGAAFTVWLVAGTVFGGSKAADLTKND